MFEILLFSVFLLSSKMLTKDCVSAPVRRVDISPSLHIADHTVQLFSFVCVDEHFVK